MPSLHELQAGFARALTSAEPAPPGIEVYRNNVRANYRNAMGATYGVVRELVGEAFFHAAVDHYVEAHPSTSGDLNVFGARFGDFLADYAPAASLPYLPDVARLEWALDECGRAADATGTPEALVAALADASRALPARRLSLHPACRLVRSAHPIWHIWAWHQVEESERTPVDFEGEGDAVLVRRDAGLARAERLGAAEWAWLWALAQGAPLGEAVDRAMAIDAAFDLGEALRRRLSDRTIASID
jgi:hypothetical protein